jgi:DNA primase small subunit
MEPERKWINNLIQGYYSKNRKSIYNVEKREFGIGDFGKKIARRHLAFASDADLNAFLAREAPLYISHSVAYYEFPDATPMERKNWLGAELVFDLDAESTDEETMKRTKADLIRLVGTLKDDFGAREYLINFSGNRGYHLHVRDKGFLSMLSEDRKRIIEYIKGEGFDHYKMFNAFRKRMKDELMKDGNRSMVPGPRPGDAGSAGRFARAAIDVARTNPLNISKKFKDALNVDMFANGVNVGHWEKGHGLKEEDLMERLKPVSERIKLGSVNIDAGVTQDISKLIRMPGSIHGSTGLEAKILKESEVEAFDPFNDAVVFPDDKTAILLKEDVNIRIRETVLRAKKGQKAKVPAYMAAYLCLKDKATLTS